MRNHSISQICFYNNGKISEQFVVRNGHLDGLSERYHINGVLVKEYYLKDTVKIGEYIEYYENGRVSFKAGYLNGFPTGIECYFKNNGDTLKYLTINGNGEGSLPYKRWLDNGTILKGEFLDSTREVLYGFGEPVMEKSLREK